MQNKKWSGGSLLRPLRFGLLVILSCAFFNSLVSIYIPYAVKYIIDDCIPINDVLAITRVLWFTLTVIIVNWFILHYKNLKIGIETNSFQVRLRNKLFYDMQHIEYIDLYGMTYGDLYTRMTLDIESISNAIFNKIVPSIIQIIYFVAVLYLLLRINLYLTIILSSALVVCFIVISAMKKIMAKHFVAFSEVRSELNSQISDMVVGRFVIKSCNSSSAFSNKLHICNLNYIKLWLRTNIFSPMIQSTIELSIMLTYVITFIVSINEIVQNRMSIGVVFLFCSYFPQLWQKFGAFSDLYSGIIDFNVFTSRIQKNNSPQKLEEQSISSDILIDKIERISFENVSLSLDKPIFNNLSFEITGSGLYCIVGPSGIGKTTLFDLLLKFYTLDSGNIYVNDKQLKDIDSYTWRKNIGVLLQDDMLQNISVFDNIRIGNTSVSLDSVIALSIKYGFHKYISALPDGYNHIVNIDKGSVSAGCRKMIGILRALIADPQIIMLDEVTINTDSYTENLIRTVLCNIAEERICLLITHRKEDLLLAKRIISLTGMG